jgi:signal transduction histidine kinase
VHDVQAAAALIPAYVSAAAEVACGVQLDRFLAENRHEIVSRCRARVAKRRAPRPTDAEIDLGIPLFLDQLIEALALHLDRDATDTATRHGNALASSGFTVAQVIHDYGDVCQVVTALAIERNAPISNEDFRRLNRCLDDAIANAVTEFCRLRDLDIAKEGTERLGIFAHEVRNISMSLQLGFDVLTSGAVGVGGATAKVLERAMARLNSLISRSLTTVRLEVGELHRERVTVATLFEEIEAAASLSAQRKGVMFSVTRPDEKVVLDVDVQIIAAILVNLVENAIKFTPAHGHVVLSARATADRVQLDVLDECGGLPTGAIENLFRPYEQLNQDRSGMGLGLMIARRGAEAHCGEIHVRDIPGTGCVFTLELPRVA